MQNNNETNIFVTLGAKIKNARKTAGLTQEQLAEKIAVSRQAITKWESDKGIPICKCKLVEIRFLSFMIVGNS